MKTVGFTGTRKGMSKNQIINFEDVISSFDILHHGDCVGADAQAHKIFEKTGKKIIIHPPINSTMRAFCKGKNVEIRKKELYLKRNHNIVDSVDVLIACPETAHEILRSGTWATIRYARRKEKNVIILKPYITREIK